MTEENEQYVRASEFFKTSRQLSVKADVREEMQREKSQHILDESRVRQQEDWSILAGQVVGREDRKRPL